MYNAGKLAVASKYSSKSVTDNLNIKVKSVITE